MSPEIKRPPSCGNVPIPTPRVKAKAPIVIVVRGLKITIEEEQEGHEEIRPGHKVSV